MRAKLYTVGMLRAMVCWPVVILLLAYCALQSAIPGLTCLNPIFIELIRWERAHDFILFSSCNI